MHRVSIVIPCLNEAGYIGRCIESLLQQEELDSELEIIVADGMSSDGTRQEVQELSQKDQRVKLVDNPARVTPVALNTGIKASTGEVVIIMGGHAEATPLFVKRNIDALQAHPEAGCVGGMIHSVFENDTAAVIGRAMSSPFGVGNATFRTGGKAGYVDTVAFGAYRREVFDDVGYFDERLVRNQDDEFNFRILRSGCNIWFDPEIESRYYVRSSYKKLFRQYYQYGYWKVFVNALHRTVTTWRQLVPLGFVAFMLLTALASLLYPVAGFLFLAGMIFWLLVACLYALRSNEKFFHSDTALLIFTWFILHTSYGLGYARGIFDFILLRKKPDTLNPNTTR